MHLQVKSLTRCVYPSSNSVVSLDIHLYLNVSSYFGKEAMSCTPKYSKSHIHSWFRPVRSAPRAKCKCLANEAPLTKVAKEEKSWFTYVPNASLSMNRVNIICGPQNKTCRPDDQYR